MASYSPSTAITSSESKSPTILIVGAGPSGLILALSLLRNGVPVRVIEKTKRHRIGQRGAGLTLMVFSLFEALGIADQVMNRAIAAPMLRIYKMPEGVEVVKEVVIAPKRDPTPSKPYFHMVLLGQDNLDKILRAELEKLGCQVELGVELQTMEQFDNRVDVKLLKHSLKQDADDDAVAEEASYHWVIGADGAKGVVRKQAGLSFLGETAEENFYIGDLKVEGLSENYGTSLRPTETQGLFNFVVGGSKMNTNGEDVCATEESMINFIKRGTGNREDIYYKDVICMSPYRVNIRMVDTLRKGRIFVTGDAAHIHSPTGGQGMNTGIQDSFNLGWKLSLVYKGLASPSLLDTFNEERIPVVAEMLNLTTAFLKESVGNASVGAGWDRSGKVEQFGVNYRWSSIVVTKKRGARKVGGTPDAPGLVKIGSEAADAMRLFKIFSPMHHTVLLFADEVDYKSMLEILKRYPKDLVRPIVILRTGQSSSVLAGGVDVDAFEDLKGHAREAYKPEQGTAGVFVIRPDGVIGLRAGSAKALERYFRGIFGDSV
ncbi:FAD binding domain-containing protein [Flammula alnicola]|nr:FAD binding domain-containing protein [Flammula alnicola]